MRSARTYAACYEDTKSFLNALLEKLLLKFSVTDLLANLEKMLLG